MARKAGSKNLTNKEKENLLIQYLEMGQDRTIKKLAVLNPSVSVSVIQKLSATNNWKEKAEQYDLDCIKEEKRKIALKIEKNKLNIAKELEEIINIYVFNLKLSKKVEAKDLEIIYKIYKEFGLQNEEERKNNINLNIKLNKEDKETLNKLDFSNMLINEEEDDDDNK